MKRADLLRVAAAIASVAWLAAWLAACGQGEPAGEPSRRAEPADVEAPRDPAPAPGVAEKPVAAPTYACIPGSAEAGAAQYSTLCASCHGPGGNGEGPAAAGLNPKPARHTDGAYMNGLSDEHVRKVVRDGGPAVGKSPLMAPWGGSLSAIQLDDVVAYVRSLAQPPWECP